MKWLKIGIGVALAVAASFIAHLHVVAQTYYPTCVLAAGAGHATGGAAVERNSIL